MWYSNGYTHAVPSLNHFDPPIPNRHTLSIKYVYPTANAHRLYSHNDFINPVTNFAYSAVFAHSLHFYHSDGNLFSYSNP